jgi:hypothetical protein
MLTTLLHTELIIPGPYGGLLVEFDDDLVDEEVEYEAKLLASR